MQVARRSDRGAADNAHCAESLLMNTAADNAHCAESLLISTLVFLEFLWRNSCGEPECPLTWSETDWLNAGVCHGSPRKNAKRNRDDTFARLLAKTSRKDCTAMPQSQSCADTQNLSDLHQKFRNRLRTRYYQHGYTACGQKLKPRFQNVCLIDTLRLLGAKVQYTSDGPFWALADGNKMLEPLGDPFLSLKRLLR